MMVCKTISRSCVLDTIAKETYYVRELVNWMMVSIVSTWRSGSFLLQGKGDVKLLFVSFLVFGCSAKPLIAILYGSLFVSVCICKKIRIISLMNSLLKEVDLGPGTLPLKSMICLYFIQFLQSLSSFSLKQNEINPSYLDAYMRLM